MEIVITKNRKVDPTYSFVQVSVQKIQEMDTKGVDA
jgi:hypothetical protein